MAKHLMPDGWDVRSEGAPQTYEHLLDYWRYNKRVCVWAGGSDRTVFGVPSVNHAFRAWHDWCHLHWHLDFTDEDEARVAEVQCAMVLARWRPATARHVCEVIRADVIGQAAFKRKTGRFPTNQVGFVAAYLKSPTEALRGTF